MRLSITIIKKPKPALSLTPFWGKAGSFVTLTKAGELRGCIGFPYRLSLLEMQFEDAAVAAATEIPGPAVERMNSHLSESEVTILTVPLPVQGDPGNRPEKIEVGRQGLIRAWERDKRTVTSSGSD